MWFHGQLAQKNLQWHLWMVSYTLHFIKRNSRVVLFLDSFVTFFSFHGFCTLTSNEPIACTRSKSIFKSCLLKQKKCHFWALVLKLWATSLSLLNCLCKVTIALKSLLENSMWIKIASKTENATFDTDFPIMSDISLLWIVFAKALKSLKENYNLFVTSKKTKLRIHQFKVLQNVFENLQNERARLKMFL